MKAFFSKTTNLGLVLFIVLALYNIYQDVDQDIKYITNISIAEKQIHQIDKNSAIVLELQQERGLTSIFFANPSEKHLQTMLLQREKTSTILLGSTQNLLTSITSIYKLINEKQNNEREVFYAYSEVIDSLLLNTEALTFETLNNTLKNELMIYNELSSLQEILGQVRAKVGVVLSSRVLTPEDKVEIKRRNILFDHQLENTFKNDIIASRKYTRQISKTKCLKKTLFISKKLEEKFEKSQIQLSALEWFELSTCGINKINSFIKEQRKIIHEYIDYDIQKAKDKRFSNALFWLLGAIVLFIFVLISFKRSKELAKEHALLKHYKKAIDYTSIVSRLDKNRIITYVNDNLCNISQYAREEFIGHTNGLIRHSDMKDEEYQNIWNTVSKGEKWNGLLKNQKKNGDTFWTDTSIIPIFDDHGELFEYIAIRHDVSEIIHLHSEIEETQKELIYRLGEAVESRSKESGYHIKRVAHYSKLLAELSNLPESETRTLFAASSMHDVGKVAIPDSILLKPALLDEEEWKIMQTHAEIGYNLFSNSTRPILQAAANISYEHHEQYNGNGYPRGIKGKDISLYGRIVAIADVFDALCTQRVYKEKWLLDDVVEYFKKESGEQFDPDLTKLFLDNLDKFLEIQKKYQ